MKTKQEWAELLNSLAFQLEADPDKLHPVEEDAIAAFEQERGIRLPTSYSTYSQVFGAGVISKQFDISVPGYGGKGPEKIFDLEYLNVLMHEVPEYRESPNPAQYERAIFFASDIIGSNYFFDPKEITDTAFNEFAVYVLFRDWELMRVADNFGDFVVNVCLGERHDSLFTGAPVCRIFHPV